MEKYMVRREDEKTFVISRPHEGMPKGQTLGHVTVSPEMQIEMMGDAIREHLKEVVLETLRLPEVVKQELKLWRQDEHRKLNEVPEAFKTAANSFAAFSARLDRINETLTNQELAMQKMGGAFMKAMVEVHALTEERKVKRGKGGRKPVLHEAGRG